MPASHRDPILGFFATGKFPIRALNSLKKERTYKQVKKLINEAPLYRIGDKVDGHLRAGLWENIVCPTPLVRSKNWIQEFGWLAHSMVRNGASLRVFVTLNRRFEKAAMLGDYAVAVSVLDEVEKQFGASLWLADHRLLVHQLREGFTEQKEFLASLQAQIKVPIGNYLLAMFSKRREALVPYEVYEKSIAKTLIELRADSFDRIASLVEFHASPWTAQWKTMSPDLLYRGNARTLIDRYQICLKILGYFDGDITHESEVAQLATITNDLYVATADDRWLRMGSQITNSPIPAELSPPVGQLWEIHDLFHAGQFEEAAVRAEAAILDSPGEFEYYLILANANACLCKPRPIPFDQQSQAHKLANALCEIVSQEVDINIALFELYQLAHRLGDTALGVKIRLYAMRESEGAHDEGLSRYAILTSDVASVADLGMLSSALRDSLSDSFRSATDKFFTIGLEYWIETGGAEGYLSDKILPAFTAIARARVHLKKHENAEVLRLFDGLENNLETNPRLGAFVTSAKAPLQFMALVAEGKPEQAARLAVESYVRNSNFLRHVAFEDLIRGAQIGRWPELTATPFYPILVFLNGGREYDIYAALDDYLSAIGCRSPRDLISKIDKFEPAVARVLLRDVMSAPILRRGAFWAVTPDAQRVLRTEMLKLLYSLSVADQAMVVAELADINKAKLIEEAYRNIEGPKFYIDFALLYRRFAPVVENSFERYVAFKEFEERGGQLAEEHRLLEAVKTNELESKESTKPKTQTSDSQLTAIIYIVIGSYLWDDAKGFNGILRTRILHGSLENQMKRVFDAKNLLATKDRNGSYVFKPEIRMLFDMIYDPEVKAGIEKAYTEFTQDVDKVFKDLMTKLRVRASQQVAAAIVHDAPTHEMTSEDGVIDFRDLFTEPTLQQVKKAQPKTVLMVVAEIQKLFREKVEEQFCGVRNYLASSTASMLSQAIDRLDKGLDAIGNEAIRGQLRQNVLQAKTGIIPDLQIIQNWFFIADSQDSSLTSLKGIINTAAHVVNFASNGKLGRVSLEVNPDVELGAEAGVILYEVVSALLRNVVQHSSISHGQQVLIKTSLSGDGATTIVITNLVTSHEHSKAAVESARSRLGEASDSRILHRSPGGTGLRRVRALLQQIGNNVAIEPKTVGETASITIEIHY